MLSGLDQEEPEFADGASFPQITAAEMDKNRPIWNNQWVQSKVDGRSRFHAIWRHIDSGRFAGPSETKEVPDELEKIFGGRKREKRRQLRTDCRIWVIVKVSDLRVSAWTGTGKHGSVYIGQNLDGAGLNTLPSVGWGAEQIRSHHWLATSG